MIIRRSLLAGLALAALTCSAQQPTEADSTGLPGDNFSLQGALDLFKQAVDIENFEKALNTEGNNVNNLDLDGNGEIDYVRVTSHKEGDAIAIVMQVPVSKTEAQDVAVIELEKTGEDKAAVQIRGDEDLYPENTFVEPVEQKEEMKKDGKGPFSPELVQDYVVVNVWYWPCVPLCFGPRYSPWISPWYWDYYPPWWRPWHPHPWRMWWGWGFHYHHWYRHVHTCNVVHAHGIYAPRRVSSPIVQGRYRPAHERFKATRPARGNDVERTPRPGKDHMDRGTQRPGKETKPAPTPKPSKDKAGRPTRPPSKPNTRPTPKPKPNRGK